LVQSYQFDETCYLAAVKEITDHDVDNDWSKYPHVSDAGILDQILRLPNFVDQRKALQIKIKAAFINRIQQYLTEHAASPVIGANDFIETLRKQANVTLSVATGGWYETAIMKLNSAHIDTNGIPIASSNDHFSRTEIMRIALRKARVPKGSKVTYFGDAEWDKQACEDLGINFIVVGEKTSHTQRISDFSETDKAFQYIGIA